MKRAWTFLIILIITAPMLWAQQETTPSEEAAIAAYRQGSFSQAVTLYTQALSETDDPEHRARLHVNIGWTLFALGRTDEVNTHLHAALVESPNLTLVPEYYTDDFLQLFERARQAVVEGKTADAVPPPDLEATLATVEARISANDDLEAALADLDKLLAAYPLDGRLIPLKVQVLTMLGRTDEAQDLAQGRTESLIGAGAIAAIPIHDLILRANRLMEQGDSATALDLLRNAVSRQPGNVAALELMAEAAQDARQWQEAEFALKSALALQPENIGLSLRLGEIYLHKGDASAARDVFRQLTTTYPRSDRAWAALGLLEANLGNFEQAEEALTKALEENPLLPEVQLAYGELVLARGDARSALAAFQAASNLLRDDPAVLGRTGQAMLALGRYADAEPLLTSAIDRGFNGPDVLRALALCEIELGNLAEAERQVERVGPGAAGDGTVLEGMLRLEQGRADEALAILKPLTDKRSGEPLLLNLVAVALYRLERYGDAATVLDQAHQMADDNPTIEANLEAARAARAAVVLQEQAQATKPIVK